MRIFDGMSPHDSLEVSDIFICRIKNRDVSARYKKIKKDAVAFSQSIIDNTQIGEQQDRAFSVFQKVCMEINGRFDLEDACMKASLGID